MKIMFYINSIHHGGAERVMTNLANQFAETENEVVLVTSFKSEWEYPLVSAVKRISMFDGYIKGALKRNYLLVKNLRKIMKAEKPDVIVSFMAEPNFRTVIASRGLKSRVILSVRNDPNKEYGNFLFRFLAKNLFKRADGIVFQTEDAKSWFPKKVQEKSAIIFNQVDESFFNAKVDYENKDIITVGRLTSQKRHDLLIKAYSEICSKIDNKLLIYGEGNLKSQLQSLINSLNLQDRVILMGATKDVVCALENCGIFVLSSDYEGLPNALMEAMSVGLPCISTDCPCGGPKSLFDGNGGVLVSVDNLSELKDAMLLLCEDKEQRITLGNIAKEKAKRFMPNVVFSKWQDFLLK